MSKNKNNKNKVSPQPVPEQNVPLVETPHHQPSLPDFPTVLPEQQEQKGGSRHPSSKCKRCILSSS